MAKCDFCGSTIILGGTKEGEKRYCNEQCHQKGMLLAIAEKMPEEQVKQLVQQVHQGLCPKCKGNGPVDVHTSYRFGPRW
jgi:Fe-S-cluster-containing dehydrogenase component